MDSASRPPHVLVNLNAALGEEAEGKCVSVNQSRPHQLAVGANDEFVRLYDRRFVRAAQAPQGYLELRSGMDRHGYLTARMGHITPEEGVSRAAAEGSVRYLAAGHLPSYEHLLQRHGRNGSRRRTAFRRGGGVGLTFRRRPYTATYVCFSPDGRELLANMGGEQIYLFSLSEPRSSLLLPTSKLGEGGEGEAVVLPSLSERAMACKERANTEYNGKNYSAAIHHYNLALLQARHPVLLSNRAAAALKRNWY